jgi:hypothetical protein
MTKCPWYPCWTNCLPLAVWASAIDFHFSMANSHSAGLVAEGLSPGGACGPAEFGPDEQNMSLAEHLVYHALGKNKCDFLLWIPFWWLVLLAMGVKRRDSCFIHEIKRPFVVYAIYSACAAKAFTRCKENGIKASPVYFKCHLKLVFPQVFPQ